MTKDTYKAIRNKKNFLYLYFLRSGGKNVSEASFNQMINVWLLSYHRVNMTMGKQIISKFLDNKFGYSK